MIEVHPNLYVGDESDALATVDTPGWFIVHACKEPYHRAALGYKAAGAPKGHPERLVAHRPGCVILNLIDAPTKELISGEAISAAIEAIAQNISASKVLVHCNRGQSRAPTIALLYLALMTDRFDDCTYDEAAERFTRAYPRFQPAAGMAGYARQVWADEAGVWEEGTIPPTPELADPVADLPEPTRKEWPPQAGAIFTF